MIGIDTNVLARYLVQDDPLQSELAAKFIEGVTSDKPGFINHIVLCELTWVLDRCYKISKEKISDIIEQILKTVQFQVQDSQQVYFALKEYMDGSADFADCLIAQINSANGCEGTVTFDKVAGKAKGFNLLQ